MQRRAFTILELLVVVGIIALLAAIVYPMIGHYQDRGLATKCVQNLRVLGTALNLYLAENDGMMPTLRLARERLDDDVPVIDNTLDRYVASKEAFNCPADHKFWKATGTSYTWNNALNGQSSANLKFFFADQPSNVPLMGDKESFHNDPEHKVNILYADGRASKELTFTTRK